MNQGENFKLLLTNIPMCKRVFIKKLEYSAQYVYHRNSLYICFSHNFVIGMNCFLLQLHCEVFCSSLSVWAGLFKAGLI